MDVILMLIYLLVGFIFPFFLWSMSREEKLDDEEVLYDGMPLTVPVPARSSIHHPIDCRVTLTRCTDDAECQLLCLGNDDDDKLVTCGRENDVCEYDDEDGYCLNGSTLITYYWHDRAYRTCACEGDYFGSRCDRINPFRPRDWDFLTD